MTKRSQLRKHDQGKADEVILSRKRHFSYSLLNEISNRRVGGVRLLHVNGGLRNPLLTKINRS